LREIPTIDLKNLISKETSRGDEVIQRIEGNYISVCYERPRAKPKQIKIKRYVDRDTFIVGVTIWEVFKYGQRTSPNSYRYRKVESSNLSRPTI